MAIFRRYSRFRNSSEEDVADLLVRCLHEDAVVIGNFLLPSRHGGGEIDLLVIHPKGIVLCEVKHWFGKIVQFGSQVIFEDGYVQPNPIVGLMYKSKILRSYLIEQAGLSPRVSVHGCLVIDGMSAPLPAGVTDAEYIFSPDEAAEAIDDGEVVFQEGRQRLALSDATIRHVVETLCGTPPPTPSLRIGHFVVDEELPGGQFTRQYIGRCQHVVNRNVLLQRWNLKGRKEQKRKMLHRLEREAGALAKLQTYRSHGFPILYDAFRDEDDWSTFWAVLEHVEGASLETAKDRFKRNRRFRDTIVRQLNDTLGTLADAGIVHRGIREDAVLLRKNDQVVLTGFEFCSRLDAGSVRQTRPAGQQVAPEVEKGQIDVRTDIYDCACMILRLLDLDETNDPRVSAKRIKKRPLREAFVKSLRPSPKNRATNLDELREALLGAF